MNQISLLPNTIQTIILGYCWVITWRGEYVFTLREKIQLDLVSSNWLEWSKPWYYTVCKPKLNIRIDNIEQCLKHAQSKYSLYTQIHTITTEIGSRSIEKVESEASKVAAQEGILKKIINRIRRINPLTIADHIENMNNQSVQFIGNLDVYKEKDNELVQSLVSFLGNVKKFRLLQSPINNRELKVLHTIVNLNRIFNINPEVDYNQQLKEKKIKCSQYLNTISDGVVEWFRLLLPMVVKFTVSKLVIHPDIWDRVTKLKTHIPYTIPRLPKSIEHITLHNLDGTLEIPYDLLDQAPSLKTFRFYELNKGTPIKLLEYIAKTKSIRNLVVGYLEISQKTLPYYKAMFEEESQVDKWLFKVQDVQELIKIPPFPTKSISLTIQLCLNYNSQELKGFIDSRIVPLSSTLVDFHIIITNHNSLDLFKDIFIHLLNPDNPKYMTKLEKMTISLRELSQIQELKIIDQIISFFSDAVKYNQWTELILNMEFVIPYQITFPNISDILGLGKRFTIKDNDHDKYLPLISIAREYPSLYI